MREIDRLMDHYSESHQNKTNILIHAIAVPSIYLVTIGLIWTIPVFNFMAEMNVTWAHVLIIPTLMYYFKLSGPIGAAMTILSLSVFSFLYWLETALVGTAFSLLQFCLLLFVLMWVLQFIGHKIEGKKPSFFEDLRYLLVGPAWWWRHWLTRLNISY
ncbi:MAG: Mpo1-like protein [Pseudomonadota bacterium]